MKLRVRFRKSTKLFDLQRETGISSGSNVLTLAKLRKTVLKFAGEAFALNSRTSYQLSLNGKDPIKEDDNCTLRDLGLVSGDLIHILLGSESADVTGDVPNNLNPTRSSCTPGNSVDAVHTDESPSKPDKVCDLKRTLQNNATMATATAAEHVKSQAESEALVNRYVNEPVFVRDMTKDRVPQKLTSLFSSVTVETAYDALFIIIHRYMLESGFYCANTEERRMPDGWRLPSLYRVQYMHPDTGSLSCVLTMVPLTASIVAIHGSIEKSGFTCSLQLNHNEYIRILPDMSNLANVYAKPAKLSTIFKDKIAYPLLIALQHDAGVGQKFGFMGLFYEIKHHVLSYLGAISLSRMSEVCRELYTVSRDQTLWKKLYARDFGRRYPIKSDVEPDWWKAYRDLHCNLKFARKTEEKLAEMVMPPAFHPYGYPQPPFQPPPPQFPGMIGGNYDLNPFGGPPLRGRFPDMPDLPPHNPFNPDLPFGPEMDRGPGVGPVPGFGPLRGPRQPRGPSRDLGGFPRYL